MKSSGGFRMCAGAVDGTHIPGMAPSQNHKEYVNHKGQHSIVDCYYLFHNIVVDWPGSVHDARVLSNSGIFAKANSNQLFQGIPSKLIGDQDVYPLILGDPAYPLL